MSDWPYDVDEFVEHVDFDPDDKIDSADMNAVQDSIAAIQEEIARVYRPDLKPESPSAYDDEFETGALDVKWTAINCATGTVDLLSVAAAKDTWDATMYTGMMALQPGRDDDKEHGLEAEAAILRQTVVLAANCKIVAKLSFLTPPALEDVDDGVAGILLSGADGFEDDNYIWMARTALSPAGFSYGRICIGGVPTAELQALGNEDHVMITKTGNIFTAWVGDAKSWAPGTDGEYPEEQVFTFGAGVMVRLSVFTYWSPNADQINWTNPIGVFDFIRYFTNNTPLVNA